MTFLKTQRVKDVGDEVKRDLGIRNGREIARRTEIPLASVQNILKREKYKALFNIYLKYSYKAVTKISNLSPTLLSPKFQLNIESHTLLDQNHLKDLVIPYFECISQNNWKKWSTMIRVFLHGYIWLMKCTSEWTGVPLDKNPTNFMSAWSRIRTGPISVLLVRHTVLFTRHATYSNSLLVMVWIGCWCDGLEYIIFDRNSMNADIYIQTLKTYHEKLREVSF